MRCSSNGCWYGKDSSVYQQWKLTKLGTIIYYNWEGVDYNSAAYVYDLEI